jgi:uncharacterized protein
MLRIVIAGLIGIIFGTGIAIAGMINPAKVINFFDVAGNWDPSLAFVMGGALAVTAIGYRFVLARPRPILDTRFHLPQKDKIDRPLLLGSALFGVGWGITGFCPGGAIPSLGLGQSDSFVFMAAMIAGLGIAKATRTALANKSLQA